MCSPILLNLYVLYGGFAAGGHLASGKTRALAEMHFYFKRLQSLFKTTFFCLCFRLEVSSSLRSAPLVFYDACVINSRALGSSITKCRHNGKVRKSMNCFRYFIINIQKFWHIKQFLLSFIIHKKLPTEEDR